MIFQVSDLGPKLSISDVTAFSSDNDQETIDNISMINHPQPRKAAVCTSCEVDDLENIELPRKKNNQETEADFSSDQSCSVAHLTASSLLTDALYLPQDLTSSYGPRRKCRKISLTDEGERSQAHINDGTQEDKNNKPTSLNQNHLSCRDSASPSQNRFVTLTVTHDSLKSSRVYLPLSFLRENGITEPGMVTLSGKDGTRMVANLLRESSGRMSLGKGFKDFSRANGLKIGESFTLELTWENAVPVLSLFTTESRIQNRSVTLVLTHDSLRKCRLGLPLPFMRENGMTKAGTITLVGKDGSMWPASLLRESTGRMSLGKGWKDFAKGNGLEIGESFTLESIWKDATPMLSLSSTEPKRDETQGESCSKAIPKDGNKNQEEMRDSSLSESESLERPSVAALQSGVTLSM